MSKAKNTADHLQGKDWRKHMGQAQRGILSLWGFGVMTDRERTMLSERIRKVRLEMLARESMEMIRGD